jgi:hypothetical protein
MRMRMRSLLPSDTEPLRTDPLAFLESTPAAPVDRQTLQRLGAMLRVSYDDTIKEPLPVGITELAKRLARREDLRQ